MQRHNSLILSILVVFGISMNAGLLAAQESDPIAVEVGGVGTNPVTRSAAVLLYAQAENRVLPIFIGSAEAGAISRYLDGVYTPRPMTHDLISNLLDVFAGQLERVVVSDFRDSTYFALLVIRLDDKVIRVDARPSDAIAVALKQGVPIVVERKVLEALGYRHDGNELVPPTHPPAAEEIPPTEWI
ncbi:bifunctional nuclease family protein [Pelovirga terrestris]|uniref:Bifunctional nuclease family protein n=1 Tax=Pelovirga terrestris TaxID=2771352 RepID=A0A8J6QP69_9BACT|nr:bifunctional nuclease family protein [Pelovirga terrestris]MBD1401482.1 bifunctional nuclease family protein [Pelovirga terrestris]